MKTLRLLTGLVALVVGASAVLGTAESAKGGDYFPADFNHDGVVDTKDVTDFATQWLAESEGKKVTPVYECGCLNEPDSVYVLKNDVLTIFGGPDPCFTIQSDNVTFDLGGHKINEQNYIAKKGIYSSGHSNIVISNGEINNFQENGIKLDNCNHFSISNINVMANKNAILLTSSDSGLIKNVNSQSIGVPPDWTNYAGIWLSEVSEINITESSSFGTLGIHLGTRNNGRNNQVSSSSFFGTNYDVESTNSDNLFLDCTFTTENPRANFLTRQFTYQAIGTTSNGYLINDLLVTVQRREGDLEFALRTQLDGKTPRIPLTAYVNSKEGSKIYTPFTVTAEKDGRISSHAYEPNRENTLDTFVLEAE